MHAAATSQLDRWLVAVIGWIEDDDLIARVDHRLNGAEDRLGRPRGDGHLAIGIDLYPITASNLGGDLPTQHRQAGHGRILVVAGTNVSSHRVTQCLRRCKVGKALGEVECAGLIGQRRHAGEDGRADIRQLTADHGPFPAGHPALGGAGGFEDIPLSGREKGALWRPF
ncbi:hypothetical protein D3C87_1671690 [compost metagenome]